MKSRPKVGSFSTLELEIYKKQQNTSWALSNVKMMLILLGIIRREERGKGQSTAERATARPCTFTGAVYRAALNSSTPSLRQRRTRTCPPALPPAEKRSALQGEAGVYIEAYFFLFEPSHL